MGKLIPLHGLETILAAARLVPDLRITVAGRGQLDALLETRPPNVEWVPWIEYDRLGDAYRSCLCALGIFGTSAKAARVIPNKVFQALACGAPVITADTPATRELLVDRESALLIPARRRGGARGCAAHGGGRPRPPRPNRTGRPPHVRGARERGRPRRRWREVLEGLL